MDAVDAVLFIVGVHTEHDELRGHHGDSAPQPATADRNSDSIMIDIAHVGFEADVRGESDGQTFRRYFVFVLR